MIYLLLIAILCILIAFWSYSHEVDIHVEHHEAEVVSKKQYPIHQGEMMYIYRHGYMGEASYPYGMAYPVETHEVKVKTNSPALPGILDFKGAEVYHGLDHGEKVTLEVRKIIKKHKITKKQKTKFEPVSILKSSGQKIKV